MNEKRKMYIAIGTYKTGTTAIQDFLKINRKKLAKEGLDVYIVVQDCEFWGDIQKQLRIKYRFPEEEKLYNYIDCDEYHWKKTLEENSGLLVQEIQKYIKKRKNDVFLAFQGLYDFHPERFEYKIKTLKKIIEPFLDEYDIILIINYRHQDSFIEGVYNTWNQPYFEADFDEFLKIFEPFSSEMTEKAEINWLKITESLKKLFPYAHIIANSYEMANKEGLFNNLCKNIHLNLNNYRLPQKNVNPGLNESGIRIMKSASFLTKEEREIFNSLMIKNESIKKKPGEKYNFLSTDNRKILFDYYYKANKELFALSDQEMIKNFGNFENGINSDLWFQDDVDPEIILIKSLLECQKNCFMHKIEKIWLRLKHNEVIYKIYYLMKRHTR